MSDIDRIETDADLSGTLTADEVEGLAWGLISSPLTHTPFLSEPSYITLLGAAYLPPECHPYNRIRIEEKVQDLSQNLPTEDP